MTVLLGARMGRPLPAWLRATGLVAGTGVAVSGLGLLSTSMAATRPGTAPWWPAAAPAALAVAAAVDGRRRDPRVLPLLVAVLATVWASGFVLRTAVGPYPGVAAAWALADVAQAAVAGLLLGGRGGPRLLNLPDVGRLLLAATAGAAAAGAVGLFVGHPVLAGRPLLLFWSVAASRAAPVLLVVPLVARLPARRRRRGPVESVALWVLVAGTAAATFAPGQWTPLTFLPMAALVVSALRLGTRTVMWQMLLVAVTVTALTATGAGPFAATGAVAGSAPIVMVQTFLVVCVFAVLVLSLAVAQRDAALDALADRREFDRSVLENVEAGVVACDADGTVVLRNAAHRRITGEEGDRPGGATVDTRGPSTPDRGGVLGRALRGGEPVDLQLRTGPPGQRPHDVVAHARGIRSADGRVLGAVAKFTDVSGEREVQARLRDAVTFRDAVLAASPDVIFLVDPGTHAVVWASRTVEVTLGVTAQQILELDRTDGPSLVHPDDRAALHAADDAATGLRDGEVRSVRVRMRDGHGRYRWMSRRVTPFSRDRDGRVTQLLGVSRDITEVVAAEERMAHAANHDALTGLLNRRALGDRLTAVIARADAGAQIPVLFCDLDGFKAVNDTGGHAAGDALLVVAAQRIAGVLRSGDTLARPGGDEFVVLLEAPPRHRDTWPGAPAAEALNRARTVARRISGSLARPMESTGPRSGTCDRDRAGAARAGRRRGAPGRRHGDVPGRRRPGATGTTCTRAPPTGTGRGRATRAEPGPPDHRDRLTPAAVTSACARRSPRRRAGPAPGRRPAGTRTTPSRPARPGGCTRTTTGSGYRCGRRSRRPGRTPTTASARAGRWAAATPGSCSRPPCGRPAASDRSGSPGRCRRRRPSPVRA